MPLNPYRSAPTEILRSSGQAAYGSALLMINAAVHVVAFPDHYKVAPYVGILFLLLAAASVPLAIGIGYGIRSAWTLAAIMSAVAILAYVLARTVGLPHYHEGDWIDAMGAWPLGLMSVIAETLFVVLYFAGRSRTGPIRRREFV